MSSSFWIIIFLFGMPMLCEMVYTPGVVGANSSFAITPTAGHETMAIFSLGLGIGNILWGTLSDKIGRRHSVLIGLALFIVSSIACYFASSFELFVASRFIQALACAMGPVVGQVIMRDIYDSKTIGKVFSRVAMLIAIFPAVCPLIGSIISQHLGWNRIFLFLSAVVLILMLFVIWKLSETKPKTVSERHSVFNVAIKMMKDKRLLSCMLLVGTCNAISLIYYSEGSFCLIDVLNMDRISYGSTFILLSCATFIGGIISSRLQNKYHVEKIINYGSVICLLGSFALLIATSLYDHYISQDSMIKIFVVCNMITRIGTCIVFTIGLSESVKEYSWCFGTSSSIFGMLHCSVTGLLAHLMTMMHSNTLYSMPVFLVLTSCFMIIARLKKTN